MNAVDTNVLVYARDPRDPDKQRVATGLISTIAPTALMWQVACEYMGTSKKLAQSGLTPERARSDLATLRRVWTTILPTWTAFDRAGELSDRLGLAFWDALLTAACLTGGVKRLYSEDFGSLTDIERLEIVNPFRTS